MSRDADPTLNELARRAQLLGCKTRVVTTSVERDASDPAGLITLAGVTGERLQVTPPAGPIQLTGDALNELLTSTHADLLRLDEADRDITLFTRQLDESFEAITLLYRLGEAVRGFLDVEGFIGQSVEGLADVLALPWCALVLDDARERLPDAVAGRVILSVADTEQHAELKSRLRAELAGLIEGENFGIAPSDDPILGPEVIIRPIPLPTGNAGWLLAGGPRRIADHSDTEASSFDSQTTEAVASLIGSVLESRRLYEEQQATFLGTLRALSSTLDAKDPYTRGHSERVALVARQLAERIGLPEAECERIHLAGTLHDIGKIGVPDRVLRKPGRLDDSEFELIKQHPTIGHRILEPIPAIRDLLPAVLHHHERWDGNGYPAKLAGEAIPMHARILSLADTFDAMSSNRAYRSGRSREEVLAEFERVRGVQFDPHLVTPFVELDFTPFDDMKREHEAGAAGNQAADDSFDSAA